MAGSPICPKTGLHARSNSLPSRPHPLVSQVDEQICSLRDSQAASTSSSMGSKLNSLQDLHDCVDKLLQLPLTQQALVHEVHQKCVDELLDASLRFLDVCSTIKDSLLQTKECIHELQSVIRRRQGDLQSEIRRFVASRKLVKKTIKKVLKNIKGTMENKEDMTMIVMLRDVEAITLAVFESLISFITEPKSPSKRPSGWSLVSKLMHHKRVACHKEEDANVNEFAIVDAALESVIGFKTSKADNVMLENLQKKLNSLDLCIPQLEDGIECLFRRMIKTRASFLNLFN